MNCFFTRVQPGKKVILRFFKFTNFTNVNKCDLKNVLR